MKSLTNKQVGDFREHGRVIARGMNDVKVEQEKNMTKAVKRRETMLRNVAERALSGT